MKNMDISSLKFDISDKDSYAEDCFAILEEYEPYAVDHFRNLDYDGHEKTDNMRTLATLARNWLLKNDYLKNDNRL